MHGPVILVAIIGHKSDDAIIELFNQCSKFRIFSMTWILVVVMIIFI